MAIALSTALVYVVAFAGLTQVTASILIVKLKLLVLSCNCASLACIVNEYVVLLLSTGAVPVITPLAYNVEPVGSEPENHE